MSYDKFTEFPILPIGNAGGNPFTSPAGYDNWRGTVKGYFDNLLERVRVFEADVEDWGAVGDGVTDSHAIIQALVDNPLYNTIRIGHTNDDVFLISQPIIGAADKTYKVGGYIKIKNGTITALTQNVTAGDTLIYVTSTTGFNVGEQIVIAEHDGSGTPRKSGSSGTIKTIGANYLELVEGAFFSTTVAGGGNVGHQQSIFLFDNKDNIDIQVTGTLDGNKANQFQSEGVKLGGGEEVRNGCCVSIWQCYTVNLYVREAKNAPLHGVSFFGNSTRYCRDVKYEAFVTGSRFKNTLVGYTRRMYIHLYEGTNAVIEDGIIFYLHSYDISFNKITVSGNPRYGISWGNYCDGLFGNDLITSGNGKGVNWSGINIKVSKIHQNDAAWFSRAYPCNNITINSWTFEDVTATHILRIRGDCQIITINNLVFDGCNGIGIFTEASHPIGAPLPPTNIDIIGGGFYNHTGATTDLAAGTDIVFTAFRNL